MAERRIISRDVIYEASGFDPASGRCRQADAFEQMAPGGFDIDGDPAGTMAVFTTAQARGLDVVYASCILVPPSPELDLFVQLTIDQRVLILGVSDQDKAGRVMADEPTEGTSRYRLASSILRDSGLGLSSIEAYRAAVSAQKGARALKGKDRELGVKDEQASFFFEFLRKMRDKEIPTIHELPDTSVI